MPQNATQTEAITTVQESAIAALLTGNTITEAAAAANIDRTTIHRWMRTDFSFQAALNRARKELRDALSAKLLGLANAAAETVEKSIVAGDVKAALGVLRGLGLLSGEPEPIGSTDPKRLAAEAADEEAMARLTSFNRHFV
jgi:hypothetical protein